MEVSVIRQVINGNIWIGLLYGIILGMRIREIPKTLLELDFFDAGCVFLYLDDMKLKSFRILFF